MLRPSSSLRRALSCPCMSPILVKTEFQSDSSRRASSTREFSHRAKRDDALEHIHRFAGKLRDQPEFSENVLDFLEQNRADVGELALLVRRR